MDIISIDARTRVSTSLLLCTSFTCLALVSCTSPEKTLTAIQDSQPEITHLQAYCKFPINSPAADAPLTDFAQNAWNQFISLTWPVDVNHRGQPNCQENYLSTSGLRTWETFATTNDIFNSPNNTPAPWNLKLNRLQTSLVLQKPTIRLKNRAKAPEQLPLDKKVEQAVGGWVTDQDGNPTYYLVSVNQTSYDYLVDNQFYKESVVNQASTIQFPNDAVEVKTAWKIMGAKDDQSRFFTTLAEVDQFDNAGVFTSTKIVTVGLVGMHIVHKAKGFPQWLWSTFEHIDNTPTDLSQHGSYYNPHCQGAYCEPNQSPLVTQQGIHIPNQITRITALDPAVVAVNKKVTSLLSGSPFQYYQLISPQWPTTPNDPGQPQGNPTPNIVANTVMESYIQPVSSCMDCHSTARIQSNRIKSDYSFLFLFVNPENN